MRIPRIYQSIPLTVGTTFVLDANATRHLAQVLRLTIGAEIDVFNGTGGEYRCYLTSIDKKTCTAEVLSFKNREIESPVSLHLAQSMVRGEKMDFIIQKAVELGITKITPLLSQYCNVNVKADRLDRKLEHWQGIVINACEQCGRNQLPIIMQPQTFQSWLKSVDEDVCLVLHPYDVETFAVSAQAKRIVVAIGPEGGFSEQEIRQLLDNHFAAMTIGPRILRSETATISALTLIQHRWGDIYTYLTRV